MAARRALVDVGLVVFVRCVKRCEKVTDFYDVHGLVGRIRVDQQWTVELSSIANGRSLDVFVSVIVYVFANAGCHLGSIFLGNIVHPFSQIAYRCACEATRVEVWMLEEIHQSDHSAVAPTHQAYTLRVEKAITLQHPLPGCHRIIVFPRSVVHRTLVWHTVSAGSSVLR